MRTTSNLRQLPAESTNSETNRKASCGWVFLLTALAVAASWIGCDEQSTAVAVEEEVQPERQTALVCELAGLPWHDGVFNPLMLDPPWSESERLFATVPNFKFPPWFEEWRATNRAVRP